MPRHTAPHTLPAGAIAYDAAKAMLEQEMAFHRRSASILSYLRRVMAQVESRSHDLTREEFDDIAAELDSVLTGHELLDAARQGDEITVRRFAGEEGAPVNFQDPRTGATALHYAAAFCARPVVRALIGSGKCDFLIRDRKGRLAWELASNADDPAMTRLLLMKTARQARERGLPFPPRRAAGPVA